MENINIKFSEVSIADVVELRHKYLRPGKPIVECYWEHDSELSTIHLGASINGDVVGVISFCSEVNPIFPQKSQLRARGLAVDIKFRGVGIATQLVIRGVDYAKQKEYDLIWANARQTSCGVLERSGFNQIGEPFQLHDIGLHYLYVQFLR